jgi:hypothetical protein
MKLTSTSERSSARPTENVKYMSKATFWKNIPESIL